ncbi:MAG: extracellular solute-binding protein, partial [Pseudomonadales bacterium]|nr:extracellular solute-binding protein [Pseudomonadales bacterium]
MPSRFSALVTSGTMHCASAAWCIRVLQRAGQLRLLVSLAALFASALLVGCSERSPEANPQAGEAERLVVYSSRNEQLLMPVLERYEALTGVKVEYATDKAGVLLERIKAEATNSPADLLITVDAGTLGFAASQGLFQPLASELVREVVPAYLRDPE